MAIGSAAVSSAGYIDAVTLVANSPPIVARQTAAIQTVLINLAPNFLVEKNTNRRNGSRARSINLNFVLRTIGSVYS